MRPAEVPRRFPRGNIRSSDQEARPNGRPEKQELRNVKKKKDPNPSKKVEGMVVTETLDWVSRKEQKLCVFLSPRLLTMQENRRETPVEKTIDDEGKN